MIFVGVATIATTLLQGIVSAALAAGEISTLPVHGFSNIPLDDRRYRWIERNAVADAPLDLLTNRPVSLINYLNFDRQSSNDSGYVHPVGSRRLRWMKGNWRAYEYNNTNGSSFTLDPRFTFRMDIGERKTILRRASGIQFYGSIREHLGYYFRFADNTERGNGPYTQRDQLLEDHAGYVGPLMGGKETYYDATEAYLNWGRDWINVTFGKDKVSWGPGRHTNLLLSDNAPSFDQLRIKTRLGNSSQFTYLVGKLHPTAGLRGDTLYRTSGGWERISVEPKWISAHRLEYAPASWLLLSVSEAIIWGERGLDAAYLNPLYFLYSAQHDGGDRDNVAMSGDFVARLPFQGIFYGALLIDDMKISKLGKGEAGNKFGLLAGVFATDAYFPNLDVGMEYTRLEPYVYSHFFPINRYSNWNSSLGADLSPNSDRLEFTLRFKPTFDFTINLAGSFNRRGTVGGTVEESIPRGDSRKVKFLDGSRDSWRSAQLGVEWEAIPGGVIEIGAITGERQSIVPDRWYFSIGYRI